MNHLTDSNRIRSSLLSINRSTVERFRIPPLISRTFVNDALAVLGLPEERGLEKAEDNPFCPSTW